MPTYTQADRPLTITTPLGKDVLFLTGLQGRETTSQLFSFQVDLLAEAQREIRFDRILGQNATVELVLPGGDKRYFNGIVKRFSQDARDDTFVHFHAEIVPKLWLLTKKVRSRIFQHLSVPDILRKVLSGLDVTYEISGVYYERDYCVQYRESDFDFASRLMEEEGIYYFFKHADGSHQMVVTDNASPSVPVQPNVIYEEVFHGVVPEMRVKSWEKIQELRSGEYTLWDHCFELPGKHLEASQKTLESVTAGKVTHKLNVGGNDQLEIYDYPGGYAQRFDGVDRSGAPRPQDLKRIYEDRDRTVKVRMEQEAVAALEIRGAGDCGHFVAGHKFTLQRHFDANGPYVLTGVEHDAHLSGYRSGEPPEFHYENHFTCIPGALRYRPQCLTPEPVIAGVQTATVVGPEGEEIFCDKYGRVKVQFHWDREGKKDANSSCWLRVAQAWAGKGWGAFFWPRIGHEVVVTFEDGDPDQPLIIGSVYNAENMPWFGLPMNKQLAGFKSASERGTAHKNYNGIVFSDLKGAEHLAIHSEHNLSLNSECDKMIHSGRHKGERVGMASMFTVGKLIPGGGSGGGAQFDEGNPWPHPQPQGIVGINSVVVFGENLQVACPANHQMTLGSNVQICVNPMGLAAGVPGLADPVGKVAALFGSGMGGNMQFTIGTNAQFTLGQSFEISVGPPKIEIHKGYKDHLWVNIFCGVLGAAAVIFLLAYDLIHTYSPSEDPRQQQFNKDREQAGDRDRATLVLVYQLLVEVLLAAIMRAEAFADHDDWIVDDAQKKLFEAHNEIAGNWEAPKLVAEQPDQKSWWTDWGALDFVCKPAVLAIGAEMILTAVADDSEG
jgi:type VI secretion system secreted protein VgrG